MRPSVKPLAENDEKPPTPLAGDFSAGVLSLPLRHPVTPKEAASLLRKRVEWIRLQIRKRRIPTVADFPGRPMIPASYVNRILEFRKANPQ